VAWRAENRPARDGSEAAGLGTRHVEAARRFGDRTQRRRARRIGNAAAAMSAGALGDVAGERRGRAALGRVTEAQGGRWKSKPAARAAGGRKSTAAAVEQSSGEAGGGRRGLGSYMEFMKTAGTLL